MNLVWLPDESLVRFTIYNSYWNDHPDADSTVLALYEGGSGKLCAVETVNNDGNLCQHELRYRSGEPPLCKAFVLNGKSAPVAAPYEWQAHETKGVTLKWNHGDHIQSGTGFGSSGGKHLLEVYRDGERLNDFTLESGNTSVCTLVSLGGGAYELTVTGAGESILTLTIGADSFSFRWRSSPMPVENVQVSNVRFEKEDASGILRLKWDSSVPSTQNTLYRVFLHSKTQNQWNICGTTSGYSMPIGFSFADTYDQAKIVPLDRSTGTQGAEFTANVSLTIKKGSDIDSCSDASFIDNGDGTYTGIFYNVPSTYHHLILMWNGYRCGYGNGLEDRGSAGSWTSYYRRIDLSGLSADAKLENCTYILSILKIDSVSPDGQSAEITVRNGSERPCALLAATDIQVSNIRFEKDAANDALFLAWDSDAAPDAANSVHYTIYAHEKDAPANNWMQTGGSGVTSLTLKLTSGDSPRVYDAFRVVPALNGVAGTPAEAALTLTVSRGADYPDAPTVSFRSTGNGNRWQMTTSGLPRADYLLILRCSDGGSGYYRGGFGGRLADWNGTSYTGVIEGSLDNLKPGVTPAECEYRISVFDTVDVTVDKRTASYQWHFCNNGNWQPVH